MSLETLGMRIRQARDARGLSARQLATRISVRPSTLEKWERGSSEPRANKLLILAGILGVPLLWLLNGNASASADYDVRVSQTSAMARKLERAIAMQRDLAALLIDISGDVARLQRDFDRVEDLPRDAAA